MIALDHRVSAVSGWGRSNASYHDVLGAELMRRGNSDLCFRRDGSITEAVEHVERHGVAVELGPVPRAGARGGHERLLPRPRWLAPRADQLPARG